MIDWTAAGTALVAVTALAGAATSFGVMRQRVSELTNRANNQDARLDKLTEAVDGAKSIASAVDLLRQSTEASNTLIMSKQDGAHTLISQRMDGLAGEVRSFMQGMATAEHRAATISRATKRPG